MWFQTSFADCCFENFLSNYPQVNAPRCPYWLVNTSSGDPWCHYYYWKVKIHCHLEGLVQDCSNSSANALELLQSCTKPCVLCGKSTLGQRWLCANLKLTQIFLYVLSAPEDTSVYWLIWQSLIYMISENIFKVKSNEMLDLRSLLYLMGLNRKGHIFSMWCFSSYVSL